MSQAVEIVIGYPPNFDTLQLKFGASDKNVFAWGNKIYNPSGKEIEPDLLLHETVHTEQQKQIGVTNWWERYVSDDEFRYSQEFAAFAAQYAYGLRVYRRKIADQMLQDFTFQLRDFYKTRRTYQQIEGDIRRRAKEYETSSTNKNT